MDETARKCFPQRSKKSSTHGCVDFFGHRKVARSDNPGGRRFKSCHPHQKSTGFDLSIFYPLRKQWYIITRKRASHHRRCISSAAGCISFRNDDIQNFVLMICNSCGIDYIHGFRRDLCEGSNSYANSSKISIL